LIPTIKESFGAIQLFDQEGFGVQKKSVNVLNSRVKTTPIGEILGSLSSPIWRVLGWEKTSASFLLRKHSQEPNAGEQHSM
jgi:hypothetical protein